MALPATGPISMRDINIELNKREIALISLDDADVRNLAEVPSGVISMESLRGKSQWINSWEQAINKTLSQSGETEFYQLYKAVIGNSQQNITVQVNGYYQSNFTRYNGRVHIDNLEAPYSVQMLVNTADGMRFVSFVNGQTQIIFEKNAICDLKILSLTILKEKN